MVARLTAVGAILAGLCFTASAQSAVVGWGLLREHDAPEDEMPAAEQPAE